MAKKKARKKFILSNEDPTPEPKSLNDLKDKLLVAGSNELLTILRELIQAGWKPSPDEVHDTVGQALRGIIDRELKDFQFYSQWAECIRVHLVDTCYESSDISDVLLRRLILPEDRGHSAFASSFPPSLKIWALFVVKEHILDWLWLSASATETSQYRKQHGLKGDIIADTISELSRNLNDALSHRHISIIARFVGRGSQPWRDQALKIMELLLRMFAASRGHGWRDEPNVDLRLAQEALRQQLDEHPHWIPIFVRFYLDQIGEDQRGLVEGMLDRVEAADEVIKALEGYQGSPDVVFHAQALASDLRGDLPSARHSHTPRPRLEPEPVLKPGMQNWGIWLEYPEAHELIVLAAEQAMTEHRADLDEYLGQDEHELCALFIKSLCDRLRETQGQLYEMFRGKREALRLNAEIKRFPKTARNDLPSEGGSNLWYADLGILVHAKFPGLIEMHRGTLFQAKKLEHKPKGKVWKPDLQIDKTQMKNLLAKSRESQYLFFLPSTISARSPLVLRAQLLQDMLKAQKKLQRSVLKRAGKSFVESFAYDLVGGWYGDDGPELIAALQAGEEMSQGPRLILDVTIEVGENG